MAKELSQAEVVARRERLESVVGDLLEASVQVCTEEELARFDGSVGLDATVVPLYSRGPSSRAGTCASDPAGGWYVREGDHRDVIGPKGKKLRKLFWANEATIVAMGRAPGALPSHPNLILAACLARPGEDPGGTAVRLLCGVRARGYPASFLGADRGYTQAHPERFHLPVRALGYSLVMDYKETELGRQANSAGAVMVEGTFYCPAMPEPLVSASADLRHGVIDGATHSARIAARASWRLVRKEGPDQGGYERFACPARGAYPHLCCRCSRRPHSGPWARSRSFSHQRTHRRSAPSPLSPSLRTSGRAIARTWRSAHRSGLGPMPPTATPSKARTATSKTLPTSPWHPLDAGAYAASPPRASSSAFF